MSDLENLSFHRAECGTNYREKLSSPGLTHVGTASPCRNGLAGAPGRGKAIRVWHEVTLPDFINGFVGKVPWGKKTRDENLERLILGFFFHIKV